MNISIESSKTVYLNKSAKSELVNIARSYVNKVIAEAGRYEAAGKSTGTDPEITSSNVHDAATALEKPYRIRRTTGYKIGRFVVKILIFVFTAFTGNLFDTEKFSTKGDNTLYLFIIFFVLTVIFFVIDLLTYNEE